MLTQETVREKVKNIIKNKGVSQAFLCEGIDLPNSVMSQFLNCKKELWQEHLEALNAFIDKNYR